MIIAKLSSKRQITLPAKICRMLNLKKGDRLVLEVKNNQVLFTPVPEDFARSFAGIAGGVYGKSLQEIDNYVQEERETWE
ncbi:MAG: AbrB/MazE/SpoVT family DNA-binding domain-containing protein [Peptococcaceae bacterium]|nr:MAG: AbrB/MazE/SpoVT family DNA-binding domain-containing protein [Peptococcaceae bacterium]